MITMEEKPSRAELRQNLIEHFDTSKSIANYTLMIMWELDSKGEVKRPAGQLWRSRIANAGRAMGERIATRTEGEYVIGWLADRRDDDRE